MELPPALREAVERALDGFASADLSRAAALLSRRYRAEIRDGHAHIDGDLAARAYVATRMPATYAAIHAALAEISEVAPGFQPMTLLDVGSGPGTVLWAVAGLWPSLQRAALIETSPSIRALGARLLRDAGDAVAGLPPRIDWQTVDATATAPDFPRTDLVTAGYLLDELDQGQRDTLLSRMWQSTAGILVLIEPGTTSGWRRILRARELLLTAGAHLLAPCPHEAVCPLAAPDWCHFAVRVARSRTHLRAKRAEVPWEDEKFIYLAASRSDRKAQPASRVLAPPRRASGQVTLKLCGPDGRMDECRITRREGKRYKAAKRLRWGESF